MTISLTQVAAEKIRQQLIKRGKGKGIRIGVKTMGCSGLAYILEYVDDEFDYVKVQANGITIYIAEKDLIYVKDVSIDYVKRGLNEGFEFTNPLEKDRCGCGESFRV